MRPGPSEVQMERGGGGGLGHATHVVSPDTSQGTVGKVEAAGADVGGTRADGTTTATGKDNSNRLLLRAGAPSAQARAQGPARW